MVMALTFLASLVFGISVAQKYGWMYFNKEERRS